MFLGILLIDSPPLTGYLIKLLSQWIGKIFEYLWVILTSGSILKSFSSNSYLMRYTNFSKKEGYINDFSSFLWIILFVKIRNFLILCNLQLISVSYSFLKESFSCFIVVSWPSYKSLIKGRKGEKIIPDLQIPLVLRFSDTARNDLPYDCAACEIRFLSDYIGMAWISLLSHGCF